MARRTEPEGFVFQAHHKLPVNGRPHRSGHHGIVGEDKPNCGIVADVAGAMLEAINPKGTEVRIAPVYDATGAMLEAINP